MFLIGIWVKQPGTNEGCIWLNRKKKSLTFFLEGPLWIGKHCCWSEVTVLHTNLKFSEESQPESQLLFVFQFQRNNFSKNCLTFYFILIFPAICHLVHHDLSTSANFSPSVLFTLVCCTHRVFWSCSLGNHAAVWNNGVSFVGWGINVKIITLYQYKVRRVCPDAAISLFCYASNPPLVAYCLSRLGLIIYYVFNCTRTAMYLLQWQ